MPVEVVEETLFQPVEAHLRRRQAGHAKGRKHQRQFDFEYEFNVMARRREQQADAVLQVDVRRRLRFYQREKVARPYEVRTLATVKIVQKFKRQLRVAPIEQKHDRREPVKARICVLLTISFNVKIEN